MAFNNNCTLYLNRQDGSWTRVAVEGVHWQEQSAAVYAKPGLGGTIRVRDGAADTSKVKVWIPLIKADLTPAVKKNGFYHYLASGLMPDELNDEVLGEFLEKHPVYTITAITRHDYGSLPMQHWEIWAS